MISIPNPASASMPPKRLLVVEDEPAIRDLLIFALGKAGFTVTAAATAQEGRLKLTEGLPDLLLLDWMLPGGTSGVEFARELKNGATTRDLPIIMLTARAEEEDKVRGLTLGCDDYVTKPFSIPELLARVRAVLRRAQPGGADERLSLGGIVLDAAGQRVTAEATSADIALGPTEYRLLHFFMTHPERVYTREQVLDRVWGQNVYVEERTVDVHIRRLRKALEPWGLDALVQTVRGTGYRFSARV